MKAIIPVAGYATRLHPLTKDQPKSLLKVGNKRMLEHLIDKISEIEEIDEIHLVSNAKFYENFKDWAESFDSDSKIFVHNDQTTSNEDRLGAVGDIHYGIHHGKIDDDVLVIAGDNLFEQSLKEVHDFFKEKGSSVVPAREIHDERILKLMGNIVPDENNRIVDFVEKPEVPQSKLAATMIYMFTKADVQIFKDLMKNKTEKMDNGGDLIRYLSINSEVYTYPFDSHWIDIGSHEDLKDAHDYMNKKQDL